MIHENLSDGLVLLIGSGLSAASGLPTMAMLAEHIISQKIPYTDTSITKQWQDITDLLNANIDIESTLNTVKPEIEVEKFLINTTAQFILEKEYHAINSILSNGVRPPLCRFISKMLTICNDIPIITTNYDRLIEISAELAGIPVDTLFTGNILCKLHRHKSQQSLLFIDNNRKGHPRIKCHKHIKIYKPHGSLDWFDLHGTPIKLNLSIDLPRLMITPGFTKYIKGYEQPFDLHREEANKSIDNAKYFIVIGYGFNDHQLETHLRQKLSTTQFCLIITKSLTKNTKEIIKSSNHIWAISEDDENNNATLITNSSLTFRLDELKLWDFSTFIKEIFP